MMGRVTLPPAVQLPGAAGQGSCTGGCVELGTRSQVAMYGTMCPGVLCYPAPCALCVGVCQSTECFSSAVRASKLPAPKALVILQLVTRSFHRPGFPRTLKSVSSDTRDSLDPSMLNLKLRFYASCCPLLMCSSALVVLEGASVSDLTIAAATLAFCLSLQVARILKFVLVVIFYFSGGWLCLLKRN